VKSLEVQFGLTYIIQGAQSRAVGDQLMKKRNIVQGAAWGHLHHFLIEQDLHDGRLLSIACRRLRGGRIELTASRSHQAFASPGSMPVAAEASGGR
jgi:hypothetical protein